MKKIIAILSLFLLVVGVGVTVYLVSQQQDIRKKAVPTASLTFSPENFSKYVNDEFDIQIELATGENDTRGADVSIQFDPNYLEVIDADTAVTGIQVTPGTILPSGWVATNQTNNETGTILLAIATFSSYRGQGTFGTIKFKAKAPVTSTTISFNPAPDTIITAVGGESILETQNTATVVIAAGGDSPTATPTPTGTTAAATTTPTNIPTATATTTPTTTAVATATPTNAAAATTTPTPTTTTTGRGGGTNSTNTPTPIRTTGATNTPTPLAGTNTNQVKLTSIVSGQTIPNPKPTFSGTAVPNSTITITVHSDPITATVTTDGSGRWTWTPTEDLGPGSHTVTITAVTPAGKTTTTTSTFTVGSLPVTGNISLTLILLGCGLLILLPVLVGLVKKAPINS